MSDRGKKFDDVTARLKEIYIAKNIDYGDSFNISLDKFGKTAFVVRASDKMLRMEQLCKAEAKVKDEKFEDTVRDLANYCIMYLMSLEGKA